MAKHDKLILSITENIEKFHFNKSVANIYEMVNLVQKNIVSKSISSKALKTCMVNLTKVIHPFVPHLSEEMWKNLNCENFCFCSDWPKVSVQRKEFDYKIAIQVNGKTREIIQVNEKETKDQILKRAKDQKKILRYIEKKEIKKIIYVPKKIVNLVM